MINDNVFVEPAKVHESNVMYLHSRDWWSDQYGLWHDKTLKCTFACHIDVAMAVQIIRDEFEKMPWYKRLWGRI